MSLFSRFLLAGVLALAFPCNAQEFNRLDVTMKPLEAVGEADPELTETLSLQLMQAIERISEFRVTSAGAAQCTLKGQVTADGQRHFVTLRLFHSKTDRMLWLGNYDKRKTTVDQMAEHVVAELLAAQLSDAWP